MAIYQTQNSLKCSTNICSKKIQLKLISESIIHSFNSFLIGSSIQFDLLNQSSIKWSIPSESFHSFIHSFRMNKENKHHRLFQQISRKLHNNSIFQKWKIHQPFGRKTEKQKSLMIAKALKPFCLIPSYSLFLVLTDAHASFSSFCLGSHKYFLLSSSFFFFCSKQMWNQCFQT